MTSLAPHALLILTTGLLWLAGLGVAWRFLPGRTCERLAWSAALVMAFVVLQAQALGLFWSGYDFTTVLCSDLIFGIAGVVCFRGPLAEAFGDLRRFFAAMVAELRVPVVLLSAIVGGALWCTTLVYTFLVPVPGVDAVTYHLPIAAMIKQEARLTQFDTRCGHVNEFPRDGHMLYARSLVYTGDERAIRPLQWIAGLAAIFAIYGWMRNWGVERRIAASLAPMFLAVPAVLAQPMVLWGSIDLIFQALVIAAWGAVSWMPADRSEAYRRTLLAIGLASLAVGTKSTGILIGGLVGVFGLVRLCWLFREGWPRLALRTVAGGMALLLVLGASQYLMNLKWHDNPLAPIAITVGSHTVFPGAYASVDDLVETKRYTGTRSETLALLRSWVALRPTGEGGGSRLGGWGLAWLGAMLPGLIAGLAVAVRRRQWYLLAIGVLLFALPFLLPGGWWSRFSLYAFAAALVFLALALQSIRSGRYIPVMLVYTIGLSAVAGGASIAAQAREWGGDFNFPEETFRHSLDTFRVRYAWEWEEDRDVYLWCRDNLPKDSSVVYFFPYWLGTYHYWFYRHDTANRVYGLGGADSPEHFQSLLDDRDATYFIMDMDPKFLPYADQFGTQVFRAGRFGVYRRE